MRGVGSIGQEIVNKFGVGARYYRLGLYLSPRWVGHIQQKGYHVSDTIGYIWERPIHNNRPEYMSGELSTLEHSTLKGLEGSPVNARSIRCLPYQPFRPSD